MGVIAVETRTIEQIKPADPAINDSQENVMPRVCHQIGRCSLFNRLAKSGSLILLTKQLKRLKISTRVNNCR
jgi:hypothetical protein